MELASKAAEIRMTTTIVPTASVPPPVEREPGVALLDDRRGTFAMCLTISTEASLFVCLFFAYFYLAKGNWRWTTEAPPKLTLAVINLAVLLVSGFVMATGDRIVNRGRHATARLLVVVTIILGLGSLALDAFDTMQHIQTVKPTTDAYGSIFYTITMFHAAHQVVGIWLLLYLLILPNLEPAPYPPHRPFHNIKLYWYFVVVVWIFVIAFLYIAPNIR